MSAALRVRVVQRGGRLRVQSVGDGRYVQCPRRWRETLRCGTAFEIDAHLRADGECYVAAEQTVRYLQ